VVSQVFDDFPKLQRNVNDDKCRASVNWPDLQCEPILVGEYVPNSVLGSEKGICETIFA
jgi:hypothetical protein